ncbi:MULTISPECIES: helix-turn-helix domain-containing protein [Dehalococcoides]|uniref:MerR family transcriptional regulator n=2 Tax=root TaxID=1 RepID=A0AB33HU94_9CHLR|nr:MULTISPECIES: helix-turn-helix domain-containing protein [Dehalococcoides]POZ59849.1 excisionase family DNA binding protein [Dehalococcoides mccartyi]WRX71637.1 MerR family transcriptional regulator [Dehalococcoides mccartyi]BAZ97836.1 MerR family transcriptional regulator [Dehalococcoides mccartyi]
MTKEGMTIAQAADLLGVSTRTIRRYIKSGKIQAELVPGSFGEEYRIYEIPSDLKKEDEEDLSLQTIQTPVQFMDVVRELHEKNLALAAQLGAATEKIKQMDSQLKMLNAPGDNTPDKTPKKGWFERLWQKLGWTEKA